VHAHQQAADQLGITVPGMKSRGQRARRQLRDLLTSCCQIELDTAGAIADYRPADSGDDCGCSPAGTTSAG